MDRIHATEGAEMLDSLAPIMVPNFPEADRTARHYLAISGRMLTVLEMTESNRDRQRDTEREIARDRESNRDRQKKTQMQLTRAPPAPPARPLDISAPRPLDSTR